MVLPLAIKSYGQHDPHEALRLAGFCLTIFIFIRPGESNMPTPFRKMRHAYFSDEPDLRLATCGFRLMVHFPIQQVHQLMLPVSLHIMYFLLQRVVRKPIFHFFQHRDIRFV